MAAIFSLDLSTVSAILILYLLSVLLVRRYHSPLSNIPGPFLASCTRLWHIIRIFVGDIDTQSIKEHERHGPFVRIAHDEVSVCHRDAIRALLLNPIPKFDHCFNYFAFDIVGEVVFSQRFGFIEAGKDLGGSIAKSRSLNAYIAAAGYFKWLHDLILGNPLLSKLNLLPNNHVFDTAMAALRRRETNPHTRNDMVEHWKRAFKEHPDRMTLTPLQAAATGTVGAGADTVSAALQSFVYHMLRKPQCLEKLRAEIAAERAQGRCNDSIVSFAHAQNMEYLQACSPCVFGPVPFGLARVAPKGGLSIGERHFPEGTKLSVNPWVIHYSKELFGQDAAEYNPDRWIGEQAKRIEKYFMPFWTRV
ncbi:cytochrome P450 [Aspergillus terricola var. indicus]